VSLEGFENISSFAPALVHHFLNRQLLLPNFLDQGLDLLGDEHLLDLAQIGGVALAASGFERFTYPPDFGIAEWPAAALERDHQSSNQMGGVAEFGFPERKFGELIHGGYPVAARPPACR
jgi:hypothetical protein